MTDKTYATLTGILEVAGLAPWQVVALRAIRRRYKHLQGRIAVLTSEQAQLLDHSAQLLIRADCQHIAATCTNTLDLDDDSGELQTAKEMHCPECAHSWLD